MRAMLHNVSGVEIHALEWGNASNPPILAVHGLGGQATNFIPIAERLAAHYYVVAIDLPGRGKSQWLRPEQYHFDTYEQIIAGVIETYGWDSFRWLGTSMGGCLGMRAAGGVMRERISHLVINDIGPELYGELLPILREGVGAPPEVPSIRALADHLQAFQGEMACSARDSAYWQDMALKSARRLPSGAFTLHYDPAIVQQFHGKESDYSLWSEFESIAASILLIHGEESTFLVSATVDKMVQIQPLMAVEHYPGWGHAPFLDEPRDAALVGEFFSQLRTEA